MAAFPSSLRSTPALLPGQCQAFPQGCLFSPQTVDCEPGSEDDESLREMVELAAQRLYDALSPVC